MKLKRLTFVTSIALMLTGCLGGSETKAPSSTPSPSPIVPVVQPEPLVIENILELNFDETNGSTLAINNSGPNFTIKNAFDKPERVTGVQNTALRTDGHSTWAHGPLNLANTNEFTVQTWVALENYPADKEVPHEQLTPSALFHQANSDEGFSLDINTFGQWSFRVNLAGTAYVLKAPDEFPLYAWSHVAVVVDGFIGNITLYLNGESVASTDSNPVGAILDTANVDFVVGKGYQDRNLGIFPIVNGINGVFDNTSVAKGSMSAANISAQYAEQLATLESTADQALIVPDTRYINDLQRPIYHAMPPSAWTNEPHGLVEFNGQYHMFYQRTPNGPFKTQTVWGHMISDDFVNWQNQQNALIPSLEISDTAGYDMKGIWAGDVVVENGIAYAFYTNVNHSGPFNPGISVAISSDENLQNWQKMGPIINSDQVDDFRDPYLFKDGDTWHMIISAKINGVGGLDHYTSTDITDMQSWIRSDFSAVAYSDMDIGSQIWELPVFEPIGSDKYVLVVNPIGGNLGRFSPNAVRPVYWIGTWQNGQFTPDFNQPKNLDLIHGHLSPTVARNADNELVAIGIVDERRSSQAQLEAGWTQTFSAPRVWGLANDDATLTQRPVQELESLRLPGSLVDLVEQTVNGQQVLPLRGRSLEIIAEVDANNTASNYGLILGSNEQETELTLLYYDVANQQIVLDKSLSSLSDQAQETVLLRGDYDEAVFGKPEKFHVFIDHSVIDIFINDMAAFSARIYPTSIGSDLVSLYSEAAETRFTQVQMWQLENTGNKRSYLVLTDNGDIIEETEDGKNINVTLINNEFVDSINMGNWSLSNLPDGVTLGAVTRLNDTTATLTLVGNSSVDFDRDINNVTLTIPTTEVVTQQQPQLLVGQGISIKSIVETQSTGTVSTDAELYEGGEQGKQISISLENNSFVTPLDMANFTANNLPTGLTFTVSLSDAQTAIITLAGSTDGYENQDIAVTFSIASAALINTDPELSNGILTTNPIVFKARIVDGVSVAADAYDNVISSFDNAIDVLEANWTATGMFTELLLANAWEGTASFSAAAKIGLRAVSSCEINDNSAGCDTPTGTLTSPVFRIEQNYLYWLMAGGNGSAPVGIRLLDSIGNSLFSYSPNSCSPAFIDSDDDWTTLDVSALEGANVRIQIFDEAAGACGFVSVDHLYQSARNPLSIDGQLPQSLINAGAMNLTSTQLLSLSYNTSLPFSDSDQNVIGNFDDAIQTLADGWIATGAFDAPTDSNAWQGTASSTNQSAARVGLGAISTCEINNNREGCDLPVGSLTSPEYLVEATKSTLSFMMAGGNGNAEVGLRILNAVDDSVIQTFTPNSCGPSHIDGNDDWVTLDLSTQIGQMIKVQVFDEDIGGCGFVSVDHVHFTAKAPIVASQVQFNSDFVDFSESEGDTSLINVTVNDDAFAQVIGSFDDALNMLELGWQPTGIFSNPASSSAWAGTARNSNSSAARVGGGAVSTCEINNNIAGCDAPTGTLTSPAFKVDAIRPFLNFVMSGGDGNGDVGLRVLNANTGGEIYRYTPNSCSPSYIDSDDDWRSIDLSSQAGKFIKVLIVDNESGGCGFVSFDHINMSDTAR